MTADDDDHPVKQQLKLSQQLVMTPQLQMAIRLLQTKSTEFPIAQWRQDYPAIVELAPGEPDPIGAEEHAMQEEDGLPVWEPLQESPLPLLAEIPDVFVFGNPPQVRANRNAWPRWKASDEHGADKLREAMWVVRALRQRAKTFEAVVRALVEIRPQLAISDEPEQLEPVLVRVVAEAVGMHESTITRVAMANRLQNLHGVIALVGRGKKIGFAKS